MLPASKFHQFLARPEGWLLGVCAAGTMAALSGCGTKGAPPAAPPPPVVTVSKPVVRDFTREVDYAARVEATDRLDIRPRVGGFLSAIHVEDGAVVSAGDLLFTIDPAPFEAVVKAKEAGVEKAKAARKLAEANLERSKPLMRSGTIPAAEFDVQAAQLVQAAAELLAAEAALESARLDLAYTRITAPFSGRLSDVKPTTGALVAAGAGAAGTPLATLVSVKPVHVSFDIDEATLLRIRRRNTDGYPHSIREQNIPVKIAPGNTDDFAIPGVIDYADPALNAGTATLRVRAIVENNDLKLVPGMFARVRVEMARRPDALLIPIRALGQMQDRNFVLTLDGTGTVQFRPVKPGFEQDGMVLIEQGLSANDTFIVDGLLRVRPGVKPETRPADLQSTAAARAIPAAK